MKKEMPSNYIEGLARVSSIVEYKYPFIGTGGDINFRKRLDARNISYDEYMREASEGGTLIHGQLEDILNGIERTHYSEYSEFIDSGEKFLDDYDPQPIHIEHFITNEEDGYQGTIDLVAELQGKEWILDWKTYGLSKYKFGLHNGIYRKPNDKLKKARLQLSLYARVLGIKNIGVIELTKDNYYFHKLKLIPKKELDKIILDFNNRK